MLISLVLAIVFGGCATPEILRQPPDDFVFPIPHAAPRVDYDPGEAGRRVAVIHLDTRITTESAAVFEVLVKSLVGADEIVVEIASGGGDTAAAANISIAIAAAPAPVTCVAKYAASAAFMIFQTCSQRYVEEEGLLMVHEASFVHPAPDLVSDIKRQTELAAFNRIFARVVCHRMRLGLVECHERFVGGDWWMRADEALLVGAVDGIVVDAEYVEAALRFPEFGRKTWPQ